MVEHLGFFSDDHFYHSEWFRIFLLCNLIQIISDASQIKVLHTNYCSMQVKSYPKMCFALESVEIFEL